MRLITLLDSNALVMGPNGSYSTYTGSSRIAKPDLIFRNISRPGKLPKPGDIITLRDVDTNRLVAITELPSHVNIRLTLSELQTDVQAERFNALLYVHDVFIRTDGFYQWKLGKYAGASIEVFVLDHSAGAGLITLTGDEFTASEGFLVTNERSGAVLSFHPFHPSDVLDLYSDQDVWLSMHGEPIELDRDRRLRLTALREGPFSNSSWAGQMFRLESLDHHGFLEPGHRFRLRVPNLVMRGGGVLSNITTGTVVVRDSVLRVEEGEIEEDAAIFVYSQLENLDLFWNPTTQDNATLTSEPDRRGYTEVRTEGQVLIRPRSGTIPLKQFFSSTHGDTMSTATVVGQEAALAAGYSYRGIVGWVYERAQPYTRVARQYWNAERGDNMLTATRDGERSCSSYTFVYDDCHVIPVDTSTASRSSSPSGGSSVTAVPLNPTVANLFRTGDVGILNRRNTLVDRVSPPRAIFDRARRPVRALVLSGGGAKGAFEAGVVQALWRDGYRPDIICGVSVGAINACKLAERRADSADELVNLWKEFSSDENAVRLNNIYVDLIKRAGEEVGNTLGDSAIASWLMTLFFPGLSLLPFGLPGASARDALVVLTALTLTEVNGLNDQIRRLLNLIALTHSMHSMQPLRTRLVSHLRPERILEAGTKLRLGITDAKSGCYFSVTEPIKRGPSNSLAAYGMIELEPDMAEGGNWLTHHAHGADYYAMRLIDAAYASSTIPVFMEPLLVDLRRPEIVNDDELGRIAKISAALPSGVQELIDAAAPGGVLRDGRDPIDFDAVWRVVDEFATRQGLPSDDSALATEIRRRARLTADGQRGLGSGHQTLFDGGLVDAIPIRTAIRLGATEILVVGVDQLYLGGMNIRSSSPLTGYSWMHDLIGGDALGGVDPETLPVYQYLLGTLNNFVQHTTRGDMLASLGVLDTRRTMELAMRHLNDDQHRDFVNELLTQSRQSAQRRRALLGSSTSVGGWNEDDYGSVLDNHIHIDGIFPDRPLLESFNFDDETGVMEALELGRIAARNPVAL